MYRTSFYGVPLDNQERRRDKSNELKKDSVVSNLKHQRSQQIMFSEENKKNMFIIIFVGFFFMFSYFIVVPFNYKHLTLIGYNPIFSGLIMGFTPIGAFLSLFININWIKFSYKKPILISVFCIVIDSILYPLAIIYENIYIMAVGRFFLGLGSSRLISRGYIFHFVPKAKVSKQLLNFQIASLIGLTLGPIFTVITSAFYLSADVDHIFNLHTLPSWLNLLLSVVLFFIILVFFTEPMQSEFSIYKENPLDAEQRGVKEISRDTMTKQEKIMVDSIDDKLSEINEQNQFSDTNLVSRNIDFIARKEKKTKSYLFKSFIIFALVLTIVRVIISNLIF